jgi:hypothetical protein
MKEQEIQDRIDEVSRRVTDLSVLVHAAVGRIDRQVEANWARHQFRLNRLQVALDHLDDEVHR